MLARCDRRTGYKAPNMHISHQAGLLTCKMAERPVLRAYLPVHPGGLAGAWWHRFGLGGHFELADPLRCVRRKGA